MEKIRTMHNGVDGGFIEHTSEQQSSVKLGRNASGGYAYEIKIYNDNKEIREKELSETVEWIESFIKEKKKSMGDRYDKIE